MYLSDSFEALLYQDVLLCFNLMKLDVQRCAIVDLVFGFAQLSNHCYMHHCHILFQGSDNGCAAIYLRVRLARGLE